MKGYVAKSIAEDMSDVGTFYSSAGAGHGSAFWVAELVAYDSSLPPPATSDVSSASQLQIQKSSLTAASGIFSAADSSSNQLESATDDATPSTASEQVLTGIATEMGACEEGTGEEATEGVAEDAGALEDEPAKASAAADPQSTSGDEVRRLVAGLVAAAVARFESGSASDSPSPATTQAATPMAQPPSCPSPAAADAAAAPVAASSKDRPAIKSLSKAGSLEPHSSGSFSSTAAAAAEAAAPSPGTPAPANEARRQWSYTDANGAGPAAAATKPGPHVSRLSQTSGTAPPRTAGPTATTASPAAPAPTPRQSTSVIVGHVALERKSWQVAELRRMSVAPGYRGLGIGRRLLETLTQHARDNQFRELVLYTSGMQLPARRLYESAGWAVTEEQEWRGIKLYTYKLDLTKKR